LASKSSFSFFNWSSFFCKVLVNSSRRRRSTVEEEGGGGRRRGWGGRVR